MRVRPGCCAATRRISSASRSPHTSTPSNVRCRSLQCDTKSRVLAGSSCCASSSLMACTQGRGRSGETHTHCAAGAPGFLQTEPQASSPASCRGSQTARAPSPPGATWRAGLPPRPSPAGHPAPARRRQAPLPPARWPAPDGLAATRQPAAAAKCCPWPAAAVPGRPGQRQRASSCRVRRMRVEAALRRLTCQFDRRVTQPGPRGAATRPVSAPWAGQPGSSLAPCARPSSARLRLPRPLQSLSLEGGNLHGSPAFPAFYRPPETRVSAALLWACSPPPCLVLACIPRCPARDGSARRASCMPKW